MAATAAAPAGPAANRLVEPSGGSARQLLACGPGRVVLALPGGD
jgi:hypothetical protein